CCSTVMTVLSCCSMKLCICSQKQGLILRNSALTTKPVLFLPSEQRQRLAADERKREYHEEQRNEFESYAEEEHDEQDERTREKTEQWREFHYDGLDPSYEYNRHTI
uniref:Unique cartilage matrix-associated protein n=1 Tax=Pygocentrus nattereri TaxID=42514 RepID=A0AAR2K6L3_PYGNA